MDDQRLAALHGSLNVPAKTFPLPLQIAGAAKIVQAGLADGDDIRIIGQINQLGNRSLVSVMFVGIPTDAKTFGCCRASAFTRGKSSRLTETHSI